MRTTKINPSTVAAPLGTYSHAVRVETDEVVWLFASGQLAVDGDGELVGAGDLRQQTEDLLTQCIACHFRTHVSPNPSLNCFGAPRHRPVTVPRPTQCVMDFFSATNKPTFPQLPLAGLVCPVVPTLLT